MTLFVTKLIGKGIPHLQQGDRQLVQPYYSRKYFIILELLHCANSCLLE